MGFRGLPRLGMASMVDKKRFLGSIKLNISIHSNPRRMALMRLLNHFVRYCTRLEILGLRLKAFSDLFIDACCLNWSFASMQIDATPKSRITLKSNR